MLVDDDKLYDLFQKVPKAQVHVHLDGAPSLEYVKKLLVEEKNISYEEAEEFIKIPEKYKGLADFIGYFDRITSVIKTPEQIKQSTIDFCMQEFRDGVLYTEMRFVFHGQEQFDAVVDGIREAKIRISEISEIVPDFRLILVAERHVESSVLPSFQKAVELKEKYGNLVVGVDIAGDEQNYSLNRYKNEIEFVSNYLPLTIHAGETPYSEELSPTESMLKAIDLGAKRIGHGLVLFDDENLIKKVLEKGIGIETNISSNYMIASINPEGHPLKRMLKEGVIASFSTDDPPFFNTSMTFELFKIYKSQIAQSWDEIKTLCLNGVKMSFLQGDEKENLIKVFKQKFYDLEQNPYYSEIITNL